MSFFEIVAFLVVMVILGSITGFRLIKYITNKWFTKLESGNIAYAYRGDTLVRTIADVRGKVLVGHRLESGIEKKTWLNAMGLYWIGISVPFSQITIKSFKIEKRKEEEITMGKEPTEWIKDMGSAEVNSLRATFPRPFLLTNVELGDRQTVNLLVVAKLDVVDTYIPVPQLKGDFFGNTGSTLRAAIDDILKAIPSMDKFIAATKGEGGILAVLENDAATGAVSAFNDKLEKQVGLHLVGIAISEWDPSDKKVREAMNAKFIAEKEREAQLIAADAYKLQLGIRNEADALAAERLAKARGAKVKATLKALAAKGGSPEVLIQAAAKILQAESLVNLTSYVENGGATAVVPVGGGK